ncbi:hypothetical protein C7M52_02473 [Mixta theicola]|nr:hypothetical protein C7M52_02473 [Mixta theicola]
MRKARFIERQIIAVIKSVEAGQTVKDVSAGRPVYLKPLTATGSLNKAAWKQLI